MVEDSYSGIIVLHLQVIGQVVRPNDLDPGDAFEISGGEDPFQFYALLGKDYLWLEVLASKVLKRPFIPVQCSR